MRIVFMGTPDFAVPTLEALVHAAHEVVCVYTQPPRKAGRGKKLQPTPVHQAAERLGIEVRHPKSLKSAEEQAAFAALEADVAVVAAYGLILPQPILDAPGFGCLNIHASLLPRWRGAAPIQRAVMAGDAETGVAVMQMEAGLDTGAVLAEARTAIGPEETGADLHDRLAVMGAELIVDVLGRLPLPAVAQPAEGMTYAARIDKAEARIDWTRPAVEVDRLIRGLSPFPGAWTTAGDTRIKLLMSELTEGQGAPGTLLDDDITVACGTGALRLHTLQRAGKAAQDAETFLRGMALPRGTVLGES